MSIEKLPLDLLKANIELQLRVTRLLQESGQQWLEAAQQSGKAGIAETSAEIDDLLRTENWQALAALPGEALRRLLQERSGDAQLINQIAIKNQADFTSGLQAALEAWQKSATAVVGNTQGFLPLQDMFKQFSNVWTQPQQAQSKDTKKE